MIKLSDLQDACFERNKEWDPEKKLTIEFYGCELAGEVGEACNIIKKMARDRIGIRGGAKSNVTRAMLEDELHDALICIALVANAAGIELDPTEKFNRSSEKHGLAVRL